MRKVWQVDLDRTVLMLFVGSVPHLLERVVVEGGPCRGVRKLLNRRVERLLLHRTRRVIGASPQEGNAKSPPLRAWIVRVALAPKAGKCGGALFQAIGGPTAIRCPPTQARRVCQGLCRVYLLG